MRLDALLVEQYGDELSRSQIQKYIKTGLVSVNGAVVNRPAADVAGSDVVVMQKPLNNIQPSAVADFAKRVIYQDDNVLVINKPAGMLVHAKGGIQPEFTVADYVRSLFNPDEVSAMADNNRLGIVHRLDRATSGVMICALNLATQTQLSRQFAERKAHKVYLALVQKAPKLAEARIDLPIGRNFNRPSTFKVDGKGKPAITDYRVLRIYDDGRTLLELRPQTGRTHQLRVHLAYLGCPIVGDPVYGDGQLSDRLMLHAWQLEITIPGANGGERRTFVAEPPRDFVTYWDYVNGGTAR